MSTSAISTLGRAPSLILEMNERPAVSMSAQPQLATAYSPASGLVAIQSRSTPVGTSVSAR